MEELFSGNIWVAFFAGVIIILAYTNYNENQQMFLINIFLYGMAVFQITRIRNCLALLFVSSFIALEYLSGDKKRIELFTKLKIKIIHFLYLQVIHYQVLLLFLSLYLLHIYKGYNGNHRCLFGILSFILFFGCEHFIVTQPFKIKTVTDLLKPFDKNPYYLLEWSEDARNRYELVCEFEDKSFFKRKHSYSIVSWEFIKYNYSKQKIKRLIKDVFSGGYKQRGLSFSQYVVSRGLSVPEMQIIRTIGIERGYESHKWLRKVYEIVYSTLIFESLSQFQKDNSGPGLEHFRDYIIDIYLKNVMTKINNKRINRASEVFKDSDNVRKWPLEGVFVICMGLNFTPVDEEHIGYRKDIVDKYKLDNDKIMEFVRIINNGGLIPCETTLVLDTIDY